MLTILITSSIAYKYTKRISNIEFADAANKLERKVGNNPRVHKQTKQLHYRHWRENSLKIWSDLYGIETQETPDWYQRQFSGGTHEGAAQGLMIRMLYGSYGGVVQRFFRHRRLSRWRNTGWRIAFTSPTPPPAKPITTPPLFIRYWQTLPNTHR